MKLTSTVGNLNIFTESRLQLGDLINYQSFLVIGFGMKNFSSPLLFNLYHIALIPLNDILRSILKVILCRYISQQR